MKKSFIALLLLLVLIACTPAPSQSSKRIDLKITTSVSQWTDDMVKVSGQVTNTGNKNIDKRKYVLYISCYTKAGKLVGTGKTLIDYSIAPRESTTYDHYVSTSVPASSVNNCKVKARE